MGGDEPDGVVAKFLELYPSNCEGAKCWKPGDPDPKEPLPSDGSAFDDAREAFQILELQRATAYRTMKAKASCGKNQLIAFALAVYIGATWSPFSGKKK
jgi:hypothetical protein